MPNIEKEQEVVLLTEKLEKAKSAIIAKYIGLKVDEINALRRELSQEEIEMRVVKNRLLKIALKAAECDSLDDYLTEPNAIVFSYKDEVAAPKILKKFAKDNEKLEVKVGLLEKRIIDRVIIEQLAELPSKEEVLAQVMRCVQAPIAGIALGINAAISQVVYAVSAVVKSKEAQA